MSPEGYLPKLEPDGTTVLWECDAALRFVRVSPQVEDILGYPAEALVGAPLLEHVAPEAIDGWRDALNAQAPRYGVQVIHLHRTGRFAYLRADFEPLEGAEFSGYRGTFRDETRQRSLMARLRHLTALIESSQDFFGLADLNGAPIYLNAPGARMVGLEDPADLAGKSINDFLLPDAIDDHMTRIYPALLRDGEWRGEHQFQDFRTGAPIPIAAHTQVLRDPDTNEPVAIAIIARDLRSEQADVAARRELEQKLRQAQKMGALGRLAGGIAHDFNNLLTPILGNLDLVLLEQGVPASVRERLQAAHEAATRTASLTRQILAFGHKQVLRVTATDLSELIETTTPLLEDSARPSGLRVDCAPGLWVDADADQLVQVLVNLVVNARDALERDGEIELRVEARRLEQSEVDDLDPGDYVALAIRDEGVGIAPEHLSTIFDPFFSTKERGRGTGLGLASVHGIVAQHGGRVVVESVLGHGTTFRVFLPARSDPGRAEELQPRSDRRQPATERVLLIEDDQRVREFLTALLASEGYGVEATGTLAEARELLSPSFDLILSDVLLPDGQGPDLLADLEAARLDLPVVFMTGFQEHESVTALGEPGRHYLPKPFRPAELLAKLRVALGQ